MIYGKLPIVFLGTIASEKKDAINSQIASCLLEHLEDFRHMGIKEMAEACSVSVSSLSRFCREIGLEGFAELKELLLTTDLSFEEENDVHTTHKMSVEYGRKVQDCIALTEMSIDRRAMKEFCQELCRYEKTAVFGMMKAAGAALSLQSDLLMMGKQVYTNISYNQQMQYIQRADEKTLILIFSYTGSYFEYQAEGPFKNKKGRPRIWMVCGSRRKQPSFVGRVIRFDSRQDRTSHPYQLEFAAGLIAREYSLLDSIRGKCQ